MDPKTIDAVRSSWALVRPISDTAGALFYKNLFEADPQLESLFKGNLKQQAKKLMHMIDAAVGKLDDLPTLVPILEDLGARHGSYGVVPAHFETVGGALLRTLEQGLGAMTTSSVYSMKLGLRYVSMKAT